MLATPPGMSVDEFVIGHAGLRAPVHGAKFGMTRQQAVATALCNGNAAPTVPGGEEMLFLELTAEQRARIERSFWAFYKLAMMAADYENAERYYHDDMVAKTLDYHLVTRRGYIELLAYQLKLAPNIRYEATQVMFAHNYVTMYVEATLADGVVVPSWTRIFYFHPEQDVPQIGYMEDSGDLALFKRCVGHYLYEHPTELLGVVSAVLGHAAQATVSTTRAAIAAMTSGVAGATEADYALFMAAGGGARDLAELEHSGASADASVHQPARSDSPPSQSSEALAPPLTPAAPLADLSLSVRSLRSLAPPAAGKLLY